MSSERDKAILNSILNPFLPLGSDFDTEENGHSVDENIEITESILQTKKLEKEAVILAEKGEVKKAIEIFDEIIKTEPDLPSFYNNRAQAYRLMGDTDQALNDLNKAVALSQGRGTSCRQALCQRGLIYRKNNEDEKALNDFKAAAELGSPFAKMALVQLNPYAALCNQMLSQVMNKLKNIEQ